MKIFSCDRCGHPVFFENVQCLHCGSALAFLPDALSLAALEPAGEPAPAGLLRRVGAAGTGAAYRMCLNHALHQACNFAVPAQDPVDLCISCRQTRLLPDLSQPGNRDRWCRIEVAKRRLLYTLLQLGLASAQPDSGAADGPVFEFLADQPGAPAVLTGHRNGVITLNVAEADDDERARRRVALHEPYRTLLGHLRHESGHYYWDRLILAAGRVQAFREVFGDESRDYLQALNAHYAAGPVESPWWQGYVSAYAAAHPWEDWAETWAHYLHMVDLLETASAYQTTVVVPGPAPQACTEDTAAPVINPFARDGGDFDELVRQWVPVTLLLNSLNRSLGQNDAYPFALTEGALRKLRYVHDVIGVSTMPLAPSQAEHAQAAGAEDPPPAA